MAAKHRVVVRLTPEHRRMLEELAQEYGLSLTDTVRRIIDRYYDEIMAEAASTGESNVRGRGEVRSDH